MDELLALQRRLVEVQLQSSAKKLSERNCVQIVSKLIEMGKVEVFYTLNGKEYVTPKQLRNEIKDEIITRGGRVSTAELQAATNVDITYVCRALDQLVDEDAEMTLLDGGEVITEYYLDSIMEEAGVVLAQKGQISIGDLSDKYQLAPDLLQKAVTKRLGTILNAEFRFGTLYTVAFIQREIGRVRGAFSAATKPVSVGALVASHGFDDRMIDGVLRDLVAAGHLAGILRGREYIPQVYSVSQKKAAETFVRQNTYLPFSRASKLQIGDPYALLKPIFPDLLKLDSCVALGSTKSQLAASIEASISSKTWLDTSVEISFLSPGDYAILLPQVPSVISEWKAPDPSSPAPSMPASTAIQVLDSYVVPCAYLDDLVVKFKEQAVIAAMERLASATVGGGGASGAGGGRSGSGAGAGGGAGAGAGAGAASGKSTADGSASLPHDEDAEDEDFIIVTSSAPPPSAAAKRQASQLSAASTSSTGKKGKRGTGAKGAKAADLEPVPAAGGKGSKRKTNRRRGRRGDDSDDDSDAGSTPLPSAASNPKASKGKKGKKGRAAGVGSTSGGGSTAGAGAGAGAGMGTGEDAEAALISNKEISDKIVSWDASGISDVPELLECLTDVIAPCVRAIYAAEENKAFASVLQGRTARRRQFLTTLYDRLQEIAPHAMMFSRGFIIVDRLLQTNATIHTEATAIARPNVPESVPDRRVMDAVTGSLSAHLFDEYLKPVAFRVLAHECLLYDITLPVSAAADAHVSDAIPVLPDEPTAVGGFSPQDVSKLLDQLKSANPRGADSVSTLLAEATRRRSDPQGFLTALEAVGEQCHLRFGKFDRKSERNLVYAHQQSLFGHLRAAATSREVLRLTLLSLMNQIHGAPVTTPLGWPHVSIWLAFLRADLPEETYTKLDSFRASIATYALASDPSLEDDELPDAPPDLSRQESAEKLTSVIASVREIGLEKFKSRA